MEHDCKIVKILYLNQHCSYRCTILRWDSEHLVNTATVRTFIPTEYKSQVKRQH